MSDKIQAYRQPLVTANGIILGFFLNFAANWTKQDSPLGEGVAYLVAGCLLAGTSLLVMSLYRILSMDYPSDQAEQYYRRTIALFTVGLTLAFLGAFIRVISFWKVGGNWV